MMPAILLVAFGASSPEARGSYDLLERDVRQAYPDHTILWAWTAKSLVAKVRTLGGTAFTLGEALASLKDHGSAVVVSLHLVPGEKHREVLSEEAQGLRLAYGRPLLDDSASIRQVAEGLLRDFPKDRPVLVVGHGNGHEARFNGELHELGRALKTARPDVHLTLLEGGEDEAGLEAFLARVRTVGKVHVAPFLLVAGDHVQNDILGDDPDSLKSRLAVPDFTCDEALGRKAWVRRRFLARLGEALAELEGA